MKRTLAQFAMLVALAVLVGGPAQNAAGTVSAAAIRAAYASPAVAPLAKAAVTGTNAEALNAGHTADAPAGGIVCATEGVASSLPA